MPLFVALLLCLSVATLGLLAHASTDRNTAPTANPRIAIIIDDLGYDAEAGRAVIRSPVAFTVSIIPFTPHSQALARLATAHGKETMLHIPMETLHQPHWEHGLHMGMQQRQLHNAFDEMLNALPQVRGVNNHGGSRLTQDRQRMQWLMTRLGERQLYFIDSRTTAYSRALDAARAQQVSHSRRDIFLDNHLDADSIEAQIQQLQHLAQQRGHAIAIGHPHPITLAILHRSLPALRAAGITIVPVSALLAAP